MQLPLTEVGVGESCVLYTKTHHTHARAHTHGADANGRVRCNWMDHARKTMLRRASCRSVMWTHASRHRGICSSVRHTKPRLQCTDESSQRPVHRQNNLHSLHIAATRHNSIGVAVADLGLFWRGRLWEPKRAKQASIEGVWAYGRMKFERL